MQFLATKAPYVVAESTSSLNGTTLAYVSTILVSLLLISLVVIVVLVCRQKNKSGVYQCSLVQCKLNISIKIALNLPLLKLSPYSILQS